MQNKLQERLQKIKQIENEITQLQSTLSTYKNVELMINGYYNSYVSFEIKNNGELLMRVKNDNGDAEQRYADWSFSHSDIYEIICFLNTWYGDDD